MSNTPIQVLKFGSSVLPSAEHLHIAVHEIYRHLRDGKKVIAVTSAIGDTTDRLLHQAGLIAEQQNDEAIAELLATGETEAVALLKLALAKAGLAAHALTARCLNLQTKGPLLDATPIGIDVEPLLQKLQSRSVLIVPGFVGCHADNRLSLLGRGGSDLTALVLAHELQKHAAANESSVVAQCRLLKDVAGLYQWDPAADGPPPRRYSSISFDEAADIGGAVLQPKAVQYAKQAELRFELGQCASSRTTLVGSEVTELASASDSSIPHSTLDPASTPSKRLRVALLGLGTVGTGVYHFLAQHQDKFEFVDLVAANPHKQRQLQPPLEQLSSLAKPLKIGAEPKSDTKPDVIVELAGSSAGFAPLLIESLAAGTAVITADKEFVAQHLPALIPFHGVVGGGLRYSAAVAGVIPALEQTGHVAAATGVAKIQAVLNGTTNFILQQMADGHSYSDALQEAQQLGYAEADPSADVYGWDAARKLSLLIHQAWGVHLPPERIPCHGIAGLPQEQAGPNLRLVAEAERHADGRISASVQPQQLTSDHGLLKAEGVGNALCLVDASNQVHILIGDGAGKWPTAEAVFADLLELWRQQVESPKQKLDQKVEVPA